MLLRARDTSTVSSLRRWRAPVPVLLAALLAGSLTVIAATPAAAAAPSVIAAISGGNILAGEAGTFTVTVSNNGAVDGYNLGVFLDVPEGVSFEGSSFGTPVFYNSTNQPPTPLAAGMQRWVWEDVSDLPANGSRSGTVTVRPVQPTRGTGVTGVTTVSPVGASFTIGASAALSGDPTYLPVFNGSTGVGGGAAIAETGTSAPASVTVAIVPLLITMSEPSPESELQRGVHDHTTVYTITARATTEGDTNNAVLVDYIPAGLEFLGCGTVDNSTVDRDTADATINEYNGAARLAATPLITSNCPVPASVETVTLNAADAAAAGVTANAVYTRVEWHLGTVTAGSTVTVNYAAGIPLKQNTLAWDGTEPTALSLGQTANLDNNNGPSTRQGGITPVDGTAWTSTATIDGDYAGVIRTGANRAVVDAASATVDAMDLSILKSVAAADATFSVGHVANFTLRLFASEYMSSTGIVLTDEVPNGLCPLLPAGVTFTLDPGASVPAECEATGTVTGAQVVSATAHTDGTFTLVMQPTDGGDPAVFAMAANATHTVTYQALNRSAYVTAAAYGSTTSGDSFRNHVVATGTTHAILAIAAAYPEALQVWDDSAASIATDLTTIDKRVMPRTGVQQGLAAGVDPCTTGTFQNTTPTGFRLGDTVCFEIRVTFPSSVDVRNAVVSDFLPSGLTYAGYAVTTESTAPVYNTTVTTGGTAKGLVWTLGAQVPQVRDLYVTRGSVFVAHVWAVVNAPSNGTNLDKPENLMKYRQQNVNGDLYFLRDQADVEVDPELQLVKGVQSVTDNGGTSSATRPAASEAFPSGATFASNRDGILVAEGETVTYRIDLTSLRYQATAGEVWDLLPVGIVRANVSGLPSNAAVFDSGESGYPAGMAAGNAGRSVIVWTNVPVDTPDATTSTYTATLTYDVLIPTRMGVSTSLTNTASIIRYSAGINTSTDPAAQEYIPAGSLDTSLAASANTNGTGTTDNSEVHLPSPTVNKSIASPLDTNNDSSHVVPGEIVTSTYSVTIPAHTSVKNGVLKDVIATATNNWQIIGANTTVTDPGGTTTSGGALTMTFASQTFTIVPATGELQFPTNYTNATNSGQTFTVTLNAYVKSTSGWTQSNTSRSDAASFTSDTSGAVTTPSASVRVIEPLPAITKSADKSAVTAGETVTYTVVASNGSGRPTLFDATVTDCVPAALGTPTVTSPSSGTTVASTACGTGNADTLITWSAGDIDAGSPATLTYTAQISPAAAGGATYVNHASVKGYSLPAATPSGDRRSYSANTTKMVTVVGATLTKSVDKTTATIGEERTYTITAEIPANVNFYDSAIIDDVPAGMTISNASIGCLNEDLVSCNTDLPASGASATPLTASGTLHGWLLGDMTSNAKKRFVTVTYTGTVINVGGPTAGDTLINTARMLWNSTDGTNPTSAGATWNQGTSPDTATVTVVEPSIGMTKLINGKTSDAVNPGGTFTYVVKATNGGTSTAYDVKVTDVIPTGVVVDASTITGPGSLVGNTITWNVATVAASGNVSFTYDAKFADSTTLSGAALTNTATAESYYSHPLATTSGFDDGVRRTYGPVHATANVTPTFPVLNVTKTATGTVAYIGAEHTFTVTVKNTGEGLAKAVKVDDVLPAGFAYVPNSASVAPGGALEPTIVGQTLTWAGLTDLAKNATITITYRAVTQAGYTWNAANTGSDVPHTNTATATATDAAGFTEHFNGVTYTDAGDAAVTINDANLSLTKSHAGAIVAGANATWTLTVHNAGIDTAVGPIVITDTLPAGAVLQSISGTGWTAGTPNGSNVVTFTHGADLASSATSSLQVTVRFPSNTAAGTAATNSACVAAKTFDSNTSNNCASDPGTVTREADLKLEKVLTGSSYTAGAGISWAITVTNNGPSDSDAPFSVTDTLPVSVDWSTATGAGSGWTCGAVDSATGKVTCTTATGSLAPSDSLPPITVSATVLSSWTGTVVNSATVTGTTPEPSTPGTTNNTDTVTTGAVTASADLELVKSLASTGLSAGGTGRYRIAVTNHGPSDALNVIVTDTLPAGLTYAGGMTSAAGDTWSCTASAGVTGQVDCTLDSHLGTLSSGDSTWFEFDVAVASSLTSTVTNTATVSSDTPDPVPSNNTYDVATPPTVITNVSIAKTHPTAPTYRVGDEVTFTVSVTNDGLADAANVSVIDTLPAGATYVRVENATGWTVTGPNPSRELTLALNDPLTAGVTPVTRSIDVVVHLDAGAVPSITNAVAVTTSTTETTTRDNAATDAVPVHTPDLEIVKSADAKLVKGGDRFAFTLAVKNVDPDAFANSVTVVDAIPTDLRVETRPAAIGAPAWTCALAGTDPDGYGGTLTCNLPTLAAGASAPVITYDVTVSDSVARDSITNSATVSSPDEHASRVDARNTDSATVNVEWIHLTASSSCRNDAPWFDYTIDPHNVANGLPVTLTWYPDADANGVADGPAIATQTLPGTTNGSVIDSQILWPGAAVDAHDVGIAWPGYRVVTAGETPNWENLILDPTLPEYPLLAGALVTVTIDPQASVSTTYPLRSTACAAERNAVLTIDKSVKNGTYNRAQTFDYTMSVSNVSYGATNDVVMTDTIPSMLKVVAILPDASTDPTVADWRDCAVTGTNADGSGGLLTCVLNGWIGYGQTAPDIHLKVAFAADATTGILTNVAQVHWTDPNVANSPKLTASDSAVVIVALSAQEILALTGVTGLGGLGWAAMLILLGIALVLVYSRRRKDY